MKLLRIAALTAALITAAVLSLTNPARAQLAWRGWPGAVAAATGTGNPYATAYGYAPAYSYTTGWSYRAYAYGYSSGYGYPASRYAHHPVIRRHVTTRPRIRLLYAAGAGIRRHWQ
jgi:hypothetical protein